MLSLLHNWQELPGPRVLLIGRQPVFHGVAYAFRGHHGHTKGGMLGPHRVQVFAQLDAIDRKFFPRPGLALLLCE